MKKSILCLLLVLCLCLCMVLASCNDDPADVEVAPGEEEIGKKGEVEITKNDPGVTAPDVNETTNGTTPRY